MSEEIDPKRLVRSTPTKEGKEAHRAEGCELVYLPAYSPDYNPIEEAFAKIENLLRKAAARTKEALVEAIGVALSAVSAQDAGGFFEHAGYRSSSSPTVKRAVEGRSTLHRPGSHTDACGYSGLCGVR